MTTIAPSRRGRALVLLLAGAAALAGCQDGFFYDAAPAGSIPVALSYTLVSPPAANAAQAATPGAAFDKADAAHVVVSAGGQTLFDQTLSLQAAGTDKQVTFELQLEGDARSAQVSLELMRSTDMLFTGTGSLSLTPGQAASATIPLAPVTAGLAVSGAPTVLRIEGTAQLTAEGQFATGDGIGAVNATWQALTSNVQVSGTGVVTALSEGQAQVEASYQGFTATASFDVFDPCAAAPGSIALGQTVNGSLSRDEDCLFSSLRLGDSYGFNLPSTQLFSSTMTTDGFTPVMSTYTSGGTLLASVTVAQGTTSHTREHLYVGGDYSITASSLETGSGLADAVEGSYSLSFANVGTPQEGCQTSTIVMFGVSTSGSITGSDCEDEFDDEPAVVRRWDGFALRFDASTEGTVAATGDFPMNFTHWFGGSFQEGMFNIPPGETAYFVGSGDAGYHYFYPISEEHEGTGGYTISFTAGPPSIAPNLVRGRFSHPAQVVPEGSFTLTLDVTNIGGPMPSAASYEVDVYIAAQQDLSGPHVLLGNLFAGPSQLDNTDVDVLSQTFSIPFGVSGPHFILVDIDVLNSVGESNESNLFVLGPMDVS